MCKNTFHMRDLHLIKAFGGLHVPNVYMPSPCECVRLTCIGLGVFLKGNQLHMGTHIHGL